MIYRRTKLKRSAFTLLELLAVLTILGILIGVLAPAINKRIQEGKKKSARIQLNAIEQSLNAFNLDCGYFPTTEQGLEALINPPTIGKLCKTYSEGGYWDKKQLPLDPWKSPYKYYNPGTRNPGGYDLFSMGPDGIEDTEDDIKAWTE